jgi:ABC-type transporter Mla subunit MlaD
MSQKPDFFKLGLFVILAFGLGAAFLIIFGAGRFFHKEILAETCFNESVQGLSTGSEVKYKGIKIGTVKSITSAARIYHAKSDYVLVVISLEDGICLGQTGDTTEHRIRKAISDGLVIQLAFKGLTGSAYLETDYAPRDTQTRLSLSWKPRNIYIPSRRSNMKQFGDSVNQILENLAAINLKAMTKDIAALLKTLNQKAESFDIGKISQLTASLLEELKKTDIKINSILASPGAAKLAGDAKASFAGIRTIIDASEGPLISAIKDFQHAAQKAGSLASGIENLTWLNADRIKNILENLEVTSENLKQLSQDIRRYPGRLLFEKPPEKISGKKTK